MNELRRKIVLSAPVLSTSFLLGCGGGGDADTSLVAGGERSSAMSSSSAPGQSLFVTATSGFTDYDTVWTVVTGGGGRYLIPSASPVIQASINGTQLSLSIVETFVASSTITLVRAMTLALDNGATLANGTTFTLSATSGGAPRHSGFVDVLLRDTSSGVSDSLYAYAMDNSGSASGSIAITSFTAASGSTPAALVLTFTNVLFNAGGSPAVYNFKMSGSTTLSAPATAANWL